MAVGVMRMVEARAGGVLYTRDPLDPGREVMVINGVWGLGTAVVDGAAHADTITVDARLRRDRRAAHRGQGDPRGRRRGRRRPQRAGRRRASAALPCLTDAQAAELARHGAALEAHFGAPAGRRVGARRGRPPLDPAVAAAAARWPPRAPAALPRRVRGPAHPDRPGDRRLQGRRRRAGRHRAHRRGGGGASRPAPCSWRAPPRPGSPRRCRARRRSSPTSAPRRGTWPRWRGSTASRRSSTPGCATAVLAAGTEVTVDAFHGNVYEGRVEELLRHAAARREVLEGTPLLQALGRALEHVTPLNLADPAAEDFRPEACRTLPRHHAVRPREGDGRDVRPGRGARRRRRGGDRAARRDPRRRSTCSTWAAGSARTRRRSRPRPSSRSPSRRFSRGCGR